MLTLEHSKICKTYAFRHVWIKQRGKNALHYGWPKTQKKTCRSTCLASNTIQISLASWHVLQAPALHLIASSQAAASGCCHSKTPWPRRSVQAGRLREYARCWAAHHPHPCAPLASVTLCWNQMLCFPLLPVPVPAMKSSWHNEAAPRHGRQSLSQSL